MIKNHKIFVIVFLSIMITFLCLSNVYATNYNENSIEIEYNDKVIVFPTLLENLNCKFTDYNYTLSYCDDGKYWLNFCMAENVEKFVHVPYSSFGSLYHRLLFKNKSGENLTEFRYYFENNKWVCRDSGTDGLVRNSVVDYILSTSDIYNENDTIFFQKTPLFKGVQVVEITQVEEIPKAIAETMKTIIPIGLVVLSIFLMIYLIRLVILRAT